MLEFVKNAFRGLFVVFLWLNLIGSVVAGFVLGIKGGGGWIITGLVGGLIVGLLTNIIFGGFVATVLCIEDKIDGFEHKYTKSLKLLEANSDTPEKIERDKLLVSDKSETPEVHIVSQEANAIQEKLLSIGRDGPSGHTGIVDQKPELNAVYDAVITRVGEFGAFAEYLSGQKGVISITEIAPEMVAKVDDVLKVGDNVRVKVIGFERSGSAKLSIKALF